ncbi:MAG: glycosyltransferase family 4 protein [Clostridia bacterium]|nr:glycosyltransferase family 4 protein [Clostridia bacterium]
MQVLFWLSIGLDRRTPSEHLLTDMVEALYQQGHTVHVLQKNTNGPKPFLPERLIQLGVSTTRIECTPPQKENLAGRFAVDVRYALMSAKWLKSHREFDRIFMQSSNVAGIQTRILRHTQKGIPVVFNVQDIFPENAVYSGKMSANGIMYKCFAFMQRHAYHYASKIITISEDMKDQLTEIGVSEEKVEVVYNWSYRDTMYDPAEIDYNCLEGIIDRSKFNVVYAGNIGLMQNVEIIIRAAAQMKGEKGICFHVIGDGLYRKKLEQLAADLRAGNVFFHDMMGAECAPAIYSAADVNVIPLAENIYRTALPSKTATCLACGKPIIFAIGSESKLANFIRESTNCPVIGCNDAEALCEAILQIRQKSIECKMESLFLSSFSKSGNSGKYAECIDGIHV